LRAANALGQRGIPIAAAGGRWVWKRQGLENLNKRLRAVEAKVARESPLLTQAQLAALEKAKVEKEAHGEWESEGPGYGGAPETFDGGPVKGVGRLYQPTFIATDSKVGFAKRSDRQRALTAADLRNDQGVPFFDAHAVPLSRLLTERGPEYCGRPDSPEDERYLAIATIDQTRTKGKSPQPTGIGERFHTTLLKEVSRITFRKKIYTRLADRQTDLDGWRREYNEARVHQGRWGSGRTPRQPFLETIPLAKEKFLAA
jgi:integrase-like protein